MDKKRSLGPSSQAGRNYLDSGAKNKRFRYAGGQGRVPTSNIIGLSGHSSIAAPHLRFFLIFVFVEEGSDKCFIGLFIDLSIVSEEGLSGGVLDAQLVGNLNAKICTYLILAFSLSTLWKN